MTIMSEDFSGMLSGEQFSRLDKLSDQIADGMFKGVVKKLNIDKDTIIRDLVIRAEGEFQGQLAELLGGASGGGSQLNYSPSQFADIILGSLLKNNNDF